MKPFFKKYKIIIAAAIFILVVGAVYYFAVKLLLRAINSNSVKIQQTLASQESKKERLEELPRLREQFVMAEKEEEKMIDLFGEEKAVEMIEKVEKIAEITGNKIIMEVPGEKDKAGRLHAGTKEESELRSKLPSKDYIEMVIKLEGNYNQLLNFLEKTEEAELYADVISLNVSVKQEKSDSGLSSSAISGSKKEQEEIVTGETTLNSAIGAIFYVKK